MNFFLLLRRIKLLIVFFFLFAQVSAQSLYPPKTESPNAASMGKFGEVPVNLFTGTPEISIPLHTMTIGKINVPITMRYHSSSVKPSQQPGWTGSGWNLETGGMISRQTRGSVDEFYIDPATGVSMNAVPYYPYPGQTGVAGSEYTVGYNWYQSSQLAFDFYSHTTAGIIFGIDVEADEFSFNVMGHSGKFYYGGSAKGWQVVSDESIKIEMAGFLSPADIMTAIHSYQLPYKSTTPGHQSRMFSGFTLTVPDGTKYIFGGINAVEFSSPITSIYDAELPAFTADTWLLQSIVDPNGNTINYSYVRDYPTCIKSRSVSNYSGICTEPSGSPSGSGSYSGGNQDIQQMTGVFVWPMYLNSMQSSNEFIGFSFSEATCNRYSDDMLKYVNQISHTTNDIDNSILGLDYPTNLTRIKWSKLDKIIIKDNLHNSDNNYAGNIIRQYVFGYNNNAAQRLILNSLNSLDRKDKIIGQYQFDYNSDFNTANVGSLYADGNFSDHWGFYNRTDITTLPLDLYNNKQPNQYVVTTELLNRIKHPTGGYTAFTWEPNDYSEIVSTNRQSLYGSVGYGGGSRIAEIKNTLSDGTVVSHKKYYYKKGYSANANTASLSSSGVLNGVPQYVFSKYNTGSMGVNTYSVGMTSMNGTGNYGYTGQGSPIGYKEVVEVNLDGSYTKNLYTSYDADLNNNTHWDQAPMGYVGWQNGDTYFPFTSLASERGQIIGAFTYSSNNTLLNKIIYTYRNDMGRFNSSINLIDHSGSFGESACAGDALVLASARLVYTYAYYPVLKTITTYDQLGNNPLVQVINFTGYNANNLVTSKTEINSKNESVTYNYTYPTDYSDAVSTGMVAAHIISPVIQSSVTNNGISKQYKTNYNQPYTGIFVPQSLEIKYGNNASEISEQVNVFDAKGHPLEIQKPNGVKEVYLWGANSQYVMAKIVGTDYVTASSLVDQTKLNQAGVGYNSYTDLDIRVELNKLRTGLPNALVTTYTYACGIGLTSETDPSGRTTYYEYDSFGRLLDIRDQDNKIIKRYYYKYYSQAEDLIVDQIPNDVQSASFTSNATCVSGTVPASITYTVPAATYFSNVSKAEANQKAIAAMNTDGQAKANALSCLAPFTATNSTPQPWYATLTNLATGVSTTYSVYSGFSSNVLANLPIGMYDLSLAPMYNGSVTSPIQLVINGNIYSGMSFSVPGINISTATGFTLQSGGASSGPCSFSMASGFASPTNSISNDGVTTSFYIVFYSSSSMQPGSTYLVGTVNGGCRPSSTRTINYSTGGNSWTITIYSNGQMYWTLNYGSTTVNPYSSVGTSTLTYNL